MADTAQVQVRRIYEPPESSDGQRVLVDRLWPRGVSKERAAALERLRELAAGGPLTLLTASKRDDISEATVLQRVLAGAGRAR